MYNKRIVRNKGKQYLMVVFADILHSPSKLDDRLKLYEQ